MSLITELKGRSLGENVRNTVISGLLLALSACAPPKPAPPVDKPSTNNLPPKVTTLPEPMKDLGFRLGDYFEKGQFLELPILLPAWYFPDVDSTSHVGYFVAIDYNGEKKTASFVSSEGALGKVRILKEKQQIIYTNDFRGETTIDTLWFEPNGRTRDWFTDCEHYTKTPANISYDSIKGTLSVNKGDVGNIYQEKINLPEGVNMEPMFDGKYLRISRSTGNFTAHDHIFQKYESPNIFVSLSWMPSNKTKFDYCLGGMTDSFTNFQDFIDKVSQTK